ncbi:MAG: hypothetical protein ACI86M_000179 [Saprospiraceae bacterium]|jgi:hypothetical protein
MLVLAAISSAFLFYKKIKIDQSKTYIVEEVSESENSLPSDFHSFYDQFHIDSIFQMSRIVFPLSGVVQEGDSVLTLVEMQWLKRDWKIHKPFDNYGGTFERIFTNTGGIISETIVGNGGMFSLEKRYSKLAGEWHLIYYQGLMMHG